MSEPKWHERGTRPQLMKLLKAMGSRHLHTFQAEGAWWWTNQYLMEQYDTAAGPVPELLDYWNLPVDRPVRAEVWPSRLALHATDEAEYVQRAAAKFLTQPYEHEVVPLLHGSHQLHVRGTSYPQSPWLALYEAKGETLALNADEVAWLTRGSDQLVLHTEDGSAMKPVAFSLPGQAKRAVLMPVRLA